MLSASFSIRGAPLQRIIQLKMSRGLSLRSLTSHLLLAASPKSAPSHYNTIGHRV